jgi:hypothetical protein
MATRRTRKAQNDPCNQQEDGGNCRSRRAFCDVNENFCVFHCPHCAEEEESQNILRTPRPTREAKTIAVKNIEQQIHQVTPDKLRVVDVRRKAEEMKEHFGLVAPTKLFPKNKVLSSSTAATIIDGMNRNAKNALVNFVFEFLQKIGKILLPNADIGFLLMAECRMHQYSLFMWTTKIEFYVSSRK